jgi:hypothetical protein
MSFSTKLNVMTCMRDKCPSEFKKFSNLMSKIHKMSEAQSVKELQAAGFVFEKNIKNLPWQHCMIFIKPTN